MGIFRSFHPKIAWKKQFFSLFTPKLRRNVDFSLFSPQNCAKTGVFRSLHPQTAQKWGFFAGFAPKLRRNGDFPPFRPKTDLINRPRASPAAKMRWKRAF